MPHAVAQPKLLDQGLLSAEEGCPDFNKLDPLIELCTARNQPNNVKKWQAERANNSEIAPPPREKQP